MTDISPIGRPQATGYSRSGRAVRAGDGSTAPVRGSDRVEVSSAARFLSQLRQLPDVRQNLVDRVRAQIADGSYETQDKIDATVDAMAGELA